MNMCQARLRKSRRGVSLSSRAPRETRLAAGSRDGALEMEISSDETSSTEPQAPVVVTYSSSALIVASCCFFLLLLLAFAYWMYRIELKRSRIRLPTSRFVITRRKLDNSVEQTPFGGIFGAPPRSSKYDSIHDDSNVPEAKVLLDDTIAEQKMGGIDYLQQPSCSQSDLTKVPTPSLASLTRRREQREEKIQNRNVLFEKLLSGEEELEVFVIHEERF